MFTSMACACCCPGDFPVLALHAYPVTT